MMTDSTGAVTAGRHAGMLAAAANTALAAAGIFSLLVLFYLFYHYGWTGERMFASAAGMALYYAIPAVLAVLFFASLRLTPAYKTPIGLACLVLTLSVYGLEVFLYLNDPQRTGLSDELDHLIRQSVPDVDTRDAAQVIADLRKEGVEAVRGVLTPIAEAPAGPADGGVPSARHGHRADLIPLGGIASKPTVVCRDSGQWRIFDADEHGFHNPRGTWHSGQIDIATVGNSWTHGWCVPSDRNFAALIRQRYAATLNLGMAGEGPLQILAIVKEYLSIVRPKSVLWFYFEGNSLLELQVEMHHRLLMRYLEDGFSQGLAGRQDEIDRALVGYIDGQAALERERRGVSEATRDAVVPKVLAVMKLAALRRSVGLVYGTDSEEQEALADLEGPTLSLFSEILSQVRNHVSAWGGTVSLVYLPSRERYEAVDPGAASRQRTKVLRLADDLDIPVVDLVPVFAAHRDPLSLFPFRKHWHYNDDGHRLVAEAVLDAISSTPSNGTDGSGSTAPPPAEP
jgi:hypothetical protein